jgi:hypothetical protein
MRHGGRRFDDGFSGRRLSKSVSRGRRAIVARQTAPDFQGHIVIERTRMGFLVADT